MQTLTLAAGLHWMQSYGLQSDVVEQLLSGDRDYFQLETCFEMSKQLLPLYGCVARPGFAASAAEDDALKGQEQQVVH